MSDSACLGFERKEVVVCGGPLVGGEDWDDCRHCGHPAYEHDRLAVVEIQRLMDAITPEMMWACPCLCPLGWSGGVKGLRRDLHADVCPQRLLLMFQWHGNPSIGKSYIRLVNG